MKQTAVVAVVALVLGFLAGWSLAPSRVAPLPPPAPIHAPSPPAPSLPADVDSLRARLSDAEASAALLRREIADQDRRRQGLEAQLAVRPAASPASPAEIPPWKRVLQERVRKTTVHYRFEDVQFEDARKYFEVQGRVVINVDRQAYQANPKLDEALVQLASPEDGMSLESALNLLCRAVGCAWDLRDETILITPARR